MRRRYLKTEDEVLSQAFATAIGVTKKFYVTPLIFDELKEDHLLDDLYQTIAELSYSAIYVFNYEIGGKEFMRFISRGIYRFLVDYGYKKPKNKKKFIRKEITESEFMNSDSNNNSILDTLTLAV